MWENENSENMTHDLMQTIKGKSLGAVKNTMRKSSFNCKRKTLESETLDRVARCIYLYMI